MKDEQIEPMPGEAWRGIEEEDGDTIHIAVGMVGGVLAPRFWCPSTLLPPGKWRDPAPAFGYRIMAAWAQSKAALVVAWERVYRARDAYHRHSMTAEWNAYEAALRALVEAGGPDLRAEQDADRKASGDDASDNEACSHKA